MTDFRSLAGAAFAFLSISMTADVVAQDGTPGPNVPCVNCPVFEFQPRPESGLWNNPLDPTGTGFTIEVQGERVVAFLFIYDETGVPEWFLAAGDLELPEDGDSENVTWVLETELKRFSGGPCINCPSLPFMRDGTGGLVRFEFMGRNFARFRVDDGEYENIVPSTFGVSTEAAFPELTDYRLPDLEGAWIFQFDAPELRVFDPPRRTVWPIRLVRVECLDLDGICYEVRRDTSILITAEITPPPNPSFGDMRCSGSVNQGPLCTLELADAPAPLDIAPFVVSLRNLSSQRMLGQQTSEFIPLTLRAFRTGID